MENRIWWFHHYSSKKHKRSSSRSMAWIDLMQLLKWQSIMNISPTLSNSNWRLSTVSLSLQLILWPNLSFSLSIHHVHPAPQHIQTSTFLVIRCTLCCANICERLMSLNPSRKASTPPIWRSFFGRFWRGKGRKPARTRVTVVKVKNIVGRVALELLNLWNIHPNPTTVKIETFIKKWRNYWKWLEFFQWGQHLQLLPFFLLFLVTSSPNLHHPRPLWSASLSVHVAWSDES